MDNYNPIDALKEECERFKKTNTFNPMQVTGFYIQAACVISEVERTQVKLRHCGEEYATLYQKSSRQKTGLSQVRIGLERLRHRARGNRRADIDGMIKDIVAALSSNRQSADRGGEG